MTEIILTFASTHASITGERALLDAGISVKVMPLPGAISAGCGLCLRIPPESLTISERALHNAGVEIQGRYISENSGYKPIIDKIRQFSDTLGIRRGDVVSIIGCGGKTSLLHSLADENRAEKVLLSTTTRILRPAPNQFDREIDASVGADIVGDAANSFRSGITLVHGGDTNGKIHSPRVTLIEDAHTTYDYTFLECDGSRGLPLKGWQAHEPVVPDFTALTIGVCTLWPKGQMISELNTYNIPEFCALTGAPAGDEVTVSMIAAMVSHPEGMFQKARGRKLLLINQTETPESFALAQELTELLPRDFYEELTGVFACSLRESAICQLTKSEGTICETL